MKTTVKQLAAATLIVLSLTGFNARAEETEIKDSTREKNETVFQFEILSTAEKVSNSAIISLNEMNQETEPEMELENWMTESETWNNNFSCIDETEVKLELEGWMFDGEIGVENNPVEDGVLIIESWMTDSQLWE